MAKIGDVYKVIIYFKGQSGNNKSRPVVVLNDLGNNKYTIAEITSIPPKDSPTCFNRFKEKIVRWQECGLDKQSWVKCYKENIHNISGDRLYQYLGEMAPEDLQNVITNIFINNE